MTSAGSDFFDRHKDAIERLSLTPDTTFKRANFESERGTHFFHWDKYRDTPTSASFESMSLRTVLQRLGDAYVDENGSALWRITDVFRKTVTALRERDWTRAVQMVGIMGHYVGDLSQPMHVSSDYDGQSIQREGIHRHFEITLLEDSSADELQTQVRNAAGPVRQELLREPKTDDPIKDIRRLIIAAGQKSLAELPGILALYDRRRQDDEGLKRMLAPRLGEGAALFAHIIDRAVEESAISADFPTRTLQVQEPAFFGLDTQSME